MTASLLFAAVFYSNVYAVPGDLDPTFDSDGKVTTGFGKREYGKSIAIQSDGKIVIAGGSNGDASGSNYDFSLVRYNTDGSLDTSFGIGGEVVTPEVGEQRVGTLLIQADGKFLVVGYTRESTSVPLNLAVYRYTSNGILDTTFGTGGKVIHSFTDSSAGNDAVLQPDGKIVIAGRISVRFTIFRLNTDGTLDTSFNSVGYNTPANATSTALALALQNDGKIVACGNGGGSTGQWGRFNTDGTLEGGPNLRGANLPLIDVAVQSDGKIVFAAYGFRITRYNSDKTLDTHFGSFGVNIAYTDSTSTTTSLLIQPDGRIVIGGFSGSGLLQNFTLVRFNKNGFLDVGFGNSGRVFTPFGTTRSEINNIAQQADGKIIATGYALGSDPSDTLIDYAVVRYDAGSSNTLPNRTPFDYDGDGRADVSVFRPASNEWYRLLSLSGSVSVSSFGVSGDIPVPADYDGDGKTDIGIYRSSTRQWWYFFSSNNTINTVNWGDTNDIPRPADYDGDGKADLILYRPSNSTWVRRGSNSPTSTFAFGTTGDQPLVGDFDGDGKADPAIFRPASGEWWYASSITGQFLAVHWGASGDIPVPADYDGDGKTDFVVFRPSDGGWYILYTTGSYTIATFGTVGDKPIAADYDGDGKADIAVFRPSTGTWYFLQTTTGFGQLNFGVSTDIPTENAFLP